MNCSSFFFMRGLKLHFFLAGFVLAVTASSQQLFIPKNIQSAYQKGTRSTDGKPGNKYWQNTASYKLNVSFAPVTRLLSGVVDISYLNNSPDTLKQIWFKLYPNLYKKGSPRQSKVEPDDLTDGLSIDSMWTNNKLIDKRSFTIDATNMILGRQSLAHGESGAAFIAYFFPRIAVYDDIDGWNKNPYNGTQEFYNDFCDFDALITVPRNFLVWATGDLQNTAEVLSPAFVQKIQQAESNDGITTIIDTTDLKQQITADRAFNTWHFAASNVTDFVFATSDHYIWKSSSLVVDPVSKRRTRVDAVFNPKHKDYFEVVSDARKTVEAMSYQFPRWPYPYSHETVFDGLDQMEYPMMVNDNPVEDRAESIELTDHEIFHTMFPFYMGINETKYAWMDEGWATIGEWLISPMIDTTIVDEYGVAPYEMNAAAEVDLPISTLSTQLSGTSYFLNSYPKPAFGYLYVRDMLGDSLFTKALHYYIQQWHGKHPMPYDFFNCMNTGSGKNLNWFWKKWFFDNGLPDLAITSVSNKLKSYSVIITSKGSKPVPIDLTITFADKSVSKIHRSIEVWEKGNSTVTITIPTTQKITRVELGSTYNVDASKEDNVFVIK
jgi:hypothetical protein